MLVAVLVRQGVHVDHSRRHGFDGLSERCEVQPRLALDRIYRLPAVSMEGGQAEQPQAGLAVERAEHRDEALDFVGVELEAAAVQRRQVDQQRDMQPAGRFRRPRHGRLVRKGVLAVGPDQIRGCRRGQQRRAGGHLGMGLPMCRTDPALPVSHQPIDLVLPRADDEAAREGGRAAVGGDVRDVKILAEVDSRGAIGAGRLDPEQDAQAVSGGSNRAGGHSNHIPGRELEVEAQAGRLRFHLAFEVAAVAVARQHGAVAGMKAERASGRGVEQHLCLQAAGRCQDQRGPNVAQQQHAVLNDGWLARRRLRRSPRRPARSRRGRRLGASRSESGPVPGRGPARRPPATSL